jgi:hypothetical protein
MKEVMRSLGGSNRGSIDGELGGSTGGAWAGKLRGRNDKKIARVRNENNKVSGKVRRRWRVGSGRDTLVRPPNEMWLLSFIGGAGAHLRDQTVVRGYGSHLWVVPLSAVKTA